MAETIDPETGEAWVGLDGLDFGLAIASLKDGYMVARAGWNGKGMFLWLNRGVTDLTATAAVEDVPQAVEGVPSRLFDHATTEAAVTRLPNINLRNANGSAVIGWLASQTDMLAEDWMVVGEVPANG